MTTLEEYDKMTKQNCPTCKTELGPIEFYPHDGGWKVEGYDTRLWLSKNCRRCRYDWSLWKIGVPRQ